MATLWQTTATSGFCGRRWAALRLLAFAVTLGIGLNALSLLSGRGVGVGAAHVAYACGLVNPYTILANSAPALAFPGSLDTNPSAPFVPPPANGVIAAQYATGQPITFAEDVSRVPNPPNLNAIQVRWLFGDGSAPTTAVSPTHTFAKPGTYIVQFQAYDSYVNPPWDPVDSAQIQILPAPLSNPPVAHITADKTAITLNGSITFDAAGSRALVGAHLTYHWNFNDGSQTATGPHVTHQFNQLGSTFVALIVTDDRGASSVATINIGMVQDQQQIPTASLSASITNPQVGQQVSFDASQSAAPSEPPQDALASYVWDFGDGTPTQTTQTPTNTHTYQKTGQYTVAVQAVDQQGTPAQATLALIVSARSGAGGQAGGGTQGSGGAAAPNWPVWGGGLLILLLLAVGGYFFIQNQRAQAQLERRRLAAQELRRARRIPTGGVRPGDPRWGDPRAGSRGVSDGGTRNPRRGPPPATR